MQFCFQIQSDDFVQPVYGPQKVYYTITLVKSMSEHQLIDFLFYFIKS